MESFLERRVQTSFGMDPSWERSNLSFQSQRLRNNLGNCGNLSGGRTGAGLWKLGFSSGWKGRDNPRAVVEKATDLCERRPERYAAEKDSRGIFFDPVQRAAFPLGLVPTSGAKAGGKRVRATLGWEFSLRAE
jgi:hypothetical protein